jgi:hypothetical protein
VPALSRIAGLMGVEQELFAGVVGIGLVDPKDLLALRMQGPIGNQVVDRSARQERGVELQQGLRPQGAVV